MAGAYLRYMKRAMEKFGDEARAAFTKVGVLMASARRTAQALHPTNLHVSKALFPNDTIQSRMPDPDWLEHWLDNQIKFDAVWETKVGERILHNLSLLMNRSFKSVQELNKYRKELAASLGPKPGVPRRLRARRPPDGAAGGRCHHRPMDAATLAFDRHRPRLKGIAYRMLGSVAEAEDVVQDAWLRWHEAAHGALDSAEAWLVTVTTRIAIDRLRAAQGPTHALRRHLAARTHR